MSASIRTLLVDDEPLARHLLRELLADFPALAVAGECTNGPEALAALQAGGYDVVFLDVQMPGLDGVQVLQQLRAVGQPLPLVVFVTAYDQYAVAAFGLHAVDYLLKPLDPDRFADCVHRVQLQISQRDTYAAERHQPGPVAPRQQLDQYERSRQAARVERKGAQGALNSSAEPEHRGLPQSAGRRTSARARPPRGGERAVEA